MKPTGTVEGRRIPAGICLVLSVALLVFCPAASAVEVDAELVLLVDVTRSVSAREFNTLLEGYSQAFQSSGVLDAIQSGGLGSIAASLVFYTHSNRQEVGVGWMEISDAASAQAFAQAIEGVSRPFAQRRTGLAGALDFATSHFGEETGGVANGFESDVQAIGFLGEGVDNHSPRTNGSRATTVRNSRDAALASGVDVINALTVGAAGSVDDYFRGNVIGGQVGGDPAVVTNVADFSALESALAPALEQTILTAVPEPGHAVFLVGGVVSFSLRRRRKETLNGQTDDTR